MRLYHLITELEPAGAERVLYQLARGLAARGHQLRVGSLVAGGSVGVWLRSEGIEVFEAGARKGWRGWAGLPGAFARLTRDLRAFRPQLLHTHLFHAGAAGRLAALLAGRPRVLSHVHIVEGRPHRARDLFDHLTAWLVDRELCVSQAVASDRRERTGIAAAKLAVIPNGVDLDRARALEVVTKMKAATHLYAGQTLVLAIGRLDRQKGFDVLVAATERMIATHPTLRVVIVGEGRERPALEADIARRNLAANITLAGYREDIGRYLAAATVLAMPSRWEGFGITAVEAQAAGVPVVASNVDSLPEIVEQNVTGLLVPPDDPEALAAAILELLADEPRRAQMGVAGRQNAERYTPENMVTRCEAVYNQLIGTAPRTASGLDPNGQYGS